MPDFVRPCSDALFKYIFADPADTAPLRSLLSAVLGWPPDELADLVIEDPQLNTEHADDKHGILDVRVRTKTGDIIDIEIQLVNKNDFPRRLAYYTARLLGSQLRPGQNYNFLRRAISVGITDFTLIDDGDYHHRFRLQDLARQTELTDVLQVDLLELTKLPAQDDATLLWSWMRFIGAHDQKEIDMTVTADPAIAQAADKVRFFTADEQAQIDELRHEMWMMDQQVMHRMAVEEGLEQGLAEGAQTEQIKVARRMIALGLPIDTIADATQLTPDEITALT